MVYCETGDTLSVLAAAQYLVAIEGQTVDQVEECLAQAGCVTPLVEAFAVVLHFVYNQRSDLLSRHPQPVTLTHKPNRIDAVTQRSGLQSAADLRQRLSRRRSETTIIDRKSARPTMMVEAWPENS